MTLRVLDPTNETAPPLGEPAPRLDTLAGKTVGFISNASCATSLRWPMSSRGSSRISARRPIRILSPRSEAGTRSSPGSAIEAVARRAVCMTPSLPNVTRFPPLGS